MGCIEIFLCPIIGQLTLRLIETWDVLKSAVFPSAVRSRFGINRNMGCIEIGTCNDARAKQDD